MRPPLLIGSLALALALSGCGDAPDDHPGHSEGMTHSPGMSHSPDVGHGGTAKEPGHSAFAAIQEVVAILEAHPSTDWSTVDLGALRAHLIDMDNVVLRSTVEEVDVPGGFEAHITGDAPTRAAIQRMVPAHVQALASRTEWNLSTELVLDGVILHATSTDAKETSHLRGLGFFGILVTDSHHQVHHVAIARGQEMH